jgi:thiosulfate/3-mercaptopyruvate sulfurtransferase
LNTQLADIKEDLSIGGRHPLPKLEDFLQTISNLGISPESHVIIYDDKNGANAAARFWWMLKAIGHEKVQVLDGGFQEAAKHDFPMCSKPTIIKPTDSYQISDWKLPTATIAEVENVSQSANHLVIDVREQARFNGETEPIDLIAGHIPGAKNVPFAENLDENGLFLAPDALKTKYENIFENIQSENIIFHCGSGVTACHSILALAHAKMEIPKLYVGSWSEWSRNNKPIATDLP